jgi:hypothetical protein
VLALFDWLAPVDAGFMLGAWRGSGFHTGHPLDGLLEACRWHGKRFEDAEHVHPLVFETLGGRARSVNPVWVMPGVWLALRLPFLKSNVLGRRAAHEQLRLARQLGHPLNLFVSLSVGTAGLTACGEPDLAREWLHEAKTLAKDLGMTFMAETIVPIWTPPRLQAIRSLT